ncbi:MAG: hypothetical protein AB1634_15770 [Thermodesulfobacteriota bacterium]
MAIALEQLAEDLRISPADIINRGIAAFLDRERRAVEMDIADLADRYGVHTSAELAARIERGQICSHPAWEELIEWQNLEAYRDRLLSWQARAD